MRECGKIVLTSSISASRAMFEHTLYASSKAAVESMVLNLCAEFGQRGITTDVIAPGGTDMAAGHGARAAPPGAGKQRHGGRCRGGTPPRAAPWPAHVTSRCAQRRLRRP